MRKVYALEKAARKSLFFSDCPVATKSKKNPYFEPKPQKNLLWEPKEANAPSTLLTNNPTSKNIVEVLCYPKTKNLDRTTAYGTPIPPLADACRFKMASF